jgi:hypothetical protein
MSAGMHRHMLHAPDTQILRFAQRERPTPLDKCISDSSSCCIYWHSNVVSSSGLQNMLTHIDTRTYTHETKVYF